MRFLPTFACVAAIAAPVYSQTGDKTSAASASAVAATDGALQIARNGNEVILAWELPAGKMRQIELMRNSNRQAMGRGRVAAVRAETTLYIDEVPDLTVTYWYWLKLTLEDGRIVNIGPVPTPVASVWTP
jgi:hypothetical protein